MDVSFINYSFDSQTETYQQPKRTQNEISIAWKDLYYEISYFSNLKKQNKFLLQNLTGSFECASLNGLMGPSGAGKTTLLNCLSGNLNSNSAIYLNPSTQNSSSFIEQHVHENIVPQMAVRDVFEYAFRFKNVNTNVTQMNLHISKVMRQLMLPIDLLERTFDKCSGGEQKRIAIGQELMSQRAPFFLFVDEPTTGLDSVSAFEVINCLKLLTINYRITVIVSIHAPNNEILNLFDTLYVLAKEGVAIYSGPPSLIKEYLSENQLEIPDQQPPVEALIKIACNLPQNANVQKLVNKCSEEQRLKLSAEIESKKIVLAPNGMTNTRKMFSISDLFLQLSRLFQITFIANFKTFILSIIQLAFAFWFLTTFFVANMSLPSGCISTLKNANDSTILNSSECRQMMEDNSLIRENGTFLSYTFMFAGFFIICIGAIFVRPFVKVFRSEHRNHWYSLGVFYHALTLITLLEMTIYSIAISLPSYFFSEQNAIDNFSINWNRFGLFLVIIWLLCLYMQSIGQLIGTIFVDYPAVSMTFTILVCSIMTMFNQLFINLEKTQNFMLIQVSELIAIKFLAKGLIYVIYGIGRCKPSESVSSYLLLYDIVPEDVTKYMSRVVVNIVVIRILILIFMYWKFGSFPNLAIRKHKLKDHEDNQIHVDLNLNIENSSSKNNVATIENFHESKNKIIFGFRNLSLYESSSIFELESTNSDKSGKILRNLNGEFHFGTLNGLMGTSGAGKTSLLRVINGQCKTRLSPETEFYLSRSTKIETCFIAQEVSQHLMFGLTAKQVLVYASRLKNLHSKLDHLANAKNLLNQFELSEIGDTKVENCSGGERKRLALAQELTSQLMPNLICIDEPTSGLDSNSAEIVISCLHKLTSTHSLTIIASIHQPNLEILNMFDQLYVLARGGVCIYSGPPNQIQTHLDLISEISIDPKFAIELLIKQSCSNYENEIVDKLVQLNNQKFVNKIDLIKDTQLSIDRISPDRQRFSVESVKLLIQRYFNYILGYLWKELAFFLFIYISFSISLTQIFDPKIAQPSGCVNLEDDFGANTCIRIDQEALDKFDILLDSYKYCFFVGNMFLYTVQLQNAISFIGDFNQFKCENRNGWYSSGSLYLTKRIYEIAFLVPIVFAHVYICNYYETIRPGIFWDLVLVLLLGSLAIQSLAQICALTSKGNYVLLAMFSMTLLIISILLSNFFINLDKLNYLYRFVANFSVLRHTFEAFVLLIYGFGRCAQREVHPMLYSMQLEDQDYYRCLLMLMMNLVVFQVIAIYLLIQSVKTVQNRRQRIDRVTKYNRLP